MYSLDNLIYWLEGQGTPAADYYIKEIRRLQTVDTKLDKALSRMDCARNFLEKYELPTKMNYWDMLDTRDLRNE